MKQPYCTLHRAEHTSRCRKKPANAVKPIAKELSVESSIMCDHLGHLENSTTLAGLINGPVAAEEIRKLLSSVIGVDRSSPPGLRVVP
ncbi:MAG: hypothetical protein ABL921_08945 [Pirellula sp.]